MLKYIVQLSLRYKNLVVALALLVIVYGVYKTFRVKLDVFPEFAPPQVVIQTEAPGLSPLEVEQLVTTPIETALGGLPGMDALRSQSIQGLSVVTIIFKDNIDLFRARQTVSERLVEATTKLPQSVKAPRMGPILGSTCSILSIGLTSSNVSLMDIRSYAEWRLRPYLMAIPGVAKVDIFGGEVQQLQVKIKPEELLKYNLSINDIINAARQGIGLKGAGFIENDNQRVIIRAEAQSATPEQLAKVPVIFTDGRRLLLGDVAEVAWGAEPKFGDGLINGEKGVILLVASQLGANTLEVTENVETALKSISGEIASKGILLHNRLFRPAKFIEIALDGIRDSLLLGSILVAIILFLFLLKFRTALISFIAIPLSLLAAVIVLEFFGVTINTFTLGGFAIAIGVVVDDAIIDLENIIRRLRENQNLSAPRPWFDVIVDASLEVRHAIVFATFIVAIVFLPVLSMSGIQGKLFAPLAVAFILATIASLVVALTVTPALCYMLLHGSKVLAEPFYIRWVKAIHSGILKSLMPYKWTLAFFMILVTGAALFTTRFFEGEFLPEFREGHYFIHMSAVPGTSLEESLRLGKLVAEDLKKIPKIRSVSQQAGRAELGEDPWGPHYSEIHVDIERCDGEEEEQVVLKMREVLSKYPGVSFKIMPFLVERMEETLSGATAEFVVKVFGDDLDEIEKKGEEIEDVLSQIPGAVDVQREISGAIPEILIKLIPEKLAYWNFTPAEVLDAISACFEGAEVGQIYHQTRIIDVSVILRESERRHPETIKNLMLKNSAGIAVPLYELAEVKLVSDRHTISHEGGRRLIQITSNVQGRDIVSFSKEAKKKVSELSKNSENLHIVFAGSAEARAQTKRDLAIHSTMAGAFILLLLSAVFKNWRNLALVVINLPFALIGGVLAVFATGGTLSIGTLVGFVTLFGLSTRNTIMLISHFEHIVKKENFSWNNEAVIKGATERLVPVTMTALVTGLGLLPLALGAGEAGKEIEGPMAIVILGGLLTSTILTLVVLPVFARHFGKFN
ncbi:MAG: efflux RND transporter permease subunit [Verrucomicrobiae bacterium]|nr:efflux RND transporter permease subunit [Verrucomicrobiae bacterium]